MPTYGMHNDEPKAITGKVDELAEPGLKKHTWESDWLNQPGGEKLCKDCGCTLLAEGAIVRADFKVSDGGRVYNYVDCLGRPLSSLMELSCPVFAGVGTANSVAIEAKEIARHARVEVRRAEQQREALDARVLQLEADNVALREQLSSVTQIDVRQLAAALLELAQQAKADKALESIELRGQSVKIPKQLVEVIDVVAVRDDSAT